MPTKHIEKTTLIKEQFYVKILIIYQMITDISMDIVFTHLNKIKLLYLIQNGKTTCKLLNIRSIIWFLIAILVLKEINK